MRWTLMVDRPYPKLGLEPGDVVSLEPGSAEPMMIHRSGIVNYGAVLDAIEAGALRPLHPHEPVLGFLARLASPAPPPPVVLPRRARRLGRRDPAPPR